MPHEALLNNNAGNLGIEGNRLIPSHWSRDLLHWANIHHLHNEMTTFELGKGSKTGDFSLENCTILIDLSIFMTPWTAVLADFRSFTTGVAGQIASNLHWELHWKLQIIEVLDPLRDEQHGNWIITSFSARKWRHLNVTTGTTNKEEVRSRNFQANGRTIFSLKMVNLWHYSLEMDIKITWNKQIRLYYNILSWFDPSDFQNFEKNWEKVGTISCINFRMCVLLRRTFLPCGTVCGTECGTSWDIL